MEQFKKWASDAAINRQRRTVATLIADLALPCEAVGTSQWSLRGPAAYGRSVELALMLTGESLLVCARAGLVLDRDFAAREVAFLLLERNDQLAHGSFRLVRIGDYHEVLLAQLVDLSRERSISTLRKICMSVVDELRTMVIRLYATDLLSTEFTSPAATLACPR
jgi:hypothetical protein